MIPQALDSQVRRLHLVARRAVEDWLGGAYLSHFKGVGIAFEEVREYQPGDDVRDRLERDCPRRAPFIKRFVEERELTVVIVVDAGASMRFASGAVSKRQVAVETAALITLAALRNSDRVGLVQFGDRGRKFVPARKGPRHALRLFRDLLDEKIHPMNAEGGLAAALASLSRALHRRTLVVIASDFLTADFVAPLRIAAARHDVVAMRIQDAWERELPDVGLLALRDPESESPILLDTRDAGLRSKYREHMSARSEAVAESIRRAGAEFVALTTEGDHLETLRRCFEARRRQRGRQ